MFHILILFCNISFTFHLHFNSAGKFRTSLTFPNFILCFTSFHMNFSSQFLFSSWLLLFNSLDSFLLLRVANSFWRIFFFFLIFILQSDGTCLIFAFFQSPLGNLSAYLTYDLACHNRQVWFKFCSLKFLKWKSSWFTVLISTVQDS